MLPKRGYRDFGKTIRSNQDMGELNPTLFQKSIDVKIPNGTGRRFVNVWKYSIPKNFRTTNPSTLIKARQIFAIHEEDDCYEIQSHIPIVSVLGDFAANIEFYSLNQETMMSKLVDIENWIEAIFTLVDGDAKCVT